ncbi:MAG: hypothetical protein ACM30G_01540 [Micromonosporaceae bacterium]
MIDEISSVHPLRRDGAVLGAAHRISLDRQQRVDEGLQVGDLLPVTVE